MRRADESTSIEFLARQVGRLIARGETLDEAMQHVAAHTPDSQLPELESLRTVLTDSTAQASGRMATLNRLLRLARDGGGSRIDAAVLRFQQLADAPRIAIEDTARNLRDAVGYSAMLLFVLLAVMGLAQIFILPTFTEFFASSGLSMPSMTRIVFGQWWFLPVLLLVLATSYASLFWVAKRLTGCARNVCFLPSVFRRWPLLSTLARDSDQLVTLVYIATLRASGLSHAAARSTSAAMALDGHSRQLSPVIERYLATTEQLNLLDDELQTQVDELSRQVAMQADALGQRLAGILKLILFLTIGTFVIALYQPIFQAGAAV
jgi:type II secretory pathway component PulF